MLNQYRLTMCVNMLNKNKGGFILFIFIKHVYWPRYTPITGPFSGMLSINCDCIALRHYASSRLTIFLVSLSCRTRWHRMCNLYLNVQVNVFYTTLTLYSKHLLILWLENFFAHWRGINKQNNYYHANQSLFIACHFRCANNIFRR